VVASIEPVAEAKPGVLEVPVRITAPIVGDKYMFPIVTTGRSPALANSYRVRVVTTAAGVIGSQTLPLSADGMETGREWFLGPCVNVGSSIKPEVSASGPSAVVATPANNSVRVSWQPPTSTGGRSVAQYVATATRNPAAVRPNVAGSCVTTRALACTIKGLENGVRYAVQVTAMISLGGPSGLLTSPPSQPIQWVIPSAAGTPSPAASPCDVASGQVEVGCVWSHVGNVAEGRQILSITSSDPAVLRPGAMTLSDFTDVFGVPHTQEPEIIVDALAPGNATLCFAFAGGAMDHCSEFTVVAK
jgi:hypothetical protein